MSLERLERRRRPLENLSRDKEKGWVLEEGRRIIAFRLTTFQAMIKELETMTGGTVAEVLLYRLGRALGSSEMGYLKDEIRSEDDLEGAIDRTMQARGWVDVLTSKQRRRAKRQCTRPPAVVHHARTNAAL